MPCLQILSGLYAPASHAKSNRLDLLAQLMDVYVGGEAQGGGVVEEDDLLVGGANGE
jgi:hypothetical protein